MVAVHNLPTLVSGPGSQNCVPVTLRVRYLYSVYCHLRYHYSLISPDFRQKAVLQLDFMIISIKNNIGRDKRQTTSFLLMFVYLMVVNYSISHVHGPAKNSQQLSWIWSEQDMFCQHDQPWSSDQQHSHACTLIAQAAAFLPGWQSAAPGKELFIPVTRYLSLNLTTPTNRQTRAPPVISA